MPQPLRADRAAIVDRLHELSLRLDASLLEAEDVRARCVKARDANVWPDLQPGFRRLFEPRGPERPER